MVTICSQLGNSFMFCEETDDKITGRIVVTSDHGNMIGERAAPIPIREWGHPPKLYTEDLITVPWLVIDGQQRREVAVESPEVSRDSIKDSIINDRLENLGYV